MIFAYADQRSTGGARSRPGRPAVPIAPFESLRAVGTHGRSTMVIAWDSGVSRRAPWEMAYASNCPTARAMSILVRNAGVARRARGRQRARVASTSAASCRPPRTTWRAQPRSRRSLAERARNRAAAPRRPGRARAGRHPLSSIGAGVGCAAGRTDGQRLAAIGRGTALRVVDRCAVSSDSRPSLTPDAINPYDNEHPDINGDAVQLYLAGDRGRSGVDARARSRLATVRVRDRGWKAGRDRRRCRVVHGVRGAGYRLDADMLAAAVPEAIDVSSTRCPAAVSAGAGSSC